MNFTRPELKKDFLPQNNWNKHSPVIISLSYKIETIAELRIPEVGNANAWGKCHSSDPEPVDPLNIRINEPPAKFAPDFPCSKRKGVPFPSGVFGCHLC